MNAVMLVERAGIPAKDHEPAVEIAMDVLNRLFGPDGREAGRLEARMRRWGIEHRRLRL
jgi:hypothetical protein